MEQRLRASDFCKQDWNIISRLLFCIMECYILIVCYENTNIFSTVQFCRARILLYQDFSLVEKNEGTFRFVPKGDPPHC